MNCLFKYYIDWCWKYEKKNVMTIHPLRVHVFRCVFSVFGAFFTQRQISDVHLCWVVGKKHGGSFVWAQCERSTAHTEKWLQFLNRLLVALSLSLCFALLLRSRNGRTLKTDAGKLCRWTANINGCHPLCVSSSFFERHPIRWSRIRQCEYSEPLNILS